MMLEKYPENTKLVLSTQNSLGRKLESFGYKNKDVFVVEKETKTNNNIKISTKAKQHTIHVSGPDGYIFKLSVSEKVFEGAFTASKGAKQKIDPTRFEIDIVNEINERGGKQTFNGGNETIASSELARSIVDSLEDKIGKVKSARPVSGTSVTSNLTKLYQQFGVKSGEPKTDIIVDAGKEYLCSVKKKERSQFAAAQHNEIAAVVQVVFQNSKEEKKLAKDLASIVKNIISKENYYELRSRIPNYDEVVGSVLRFSPNKPKKEDFEAFNLILNETGLAKRFSASILELMNRKDTQKRIFQELIVGEQRFVNKEHSPSHIFAWSESTGDIFMQDIFDYVDNSFKRGAFRFGISDRGNKRGGSFRLAPTDLKEWRLTKEQFYKYQELNEVFEYEMDQVIQEAMIQKLKSFGKETKEKVANAIRYLANLAKKIFSFVSLLISKGIGKLSEMFGLEYEAEIKYSF